MSVGGVVAVFRFRCSVSAAPITGFMAFADDKNSGEITFSKKFGFMEAGTDVEDMLHHTAKHMEYLGHVSDTLLLETI